MRFVLVTLLLVACGGSGKDKEPLECVPMTCAEVGAACGAPDDGCGHALACGGCQAEEQCSTAFTCQPDHHCTATTCEAEGATCGIISDGCGGSLPCGSCDGGEVCGPGHQCECAPACSGRECGPDGCGGTCGSCTGSEVCNTAGTCEPGGSMSDPPPEWTCNPSYWDASDGCDCMCGALDPDCARADQDLYGCSGLNNPTCDATGHCTGGGSCNSVPPGPYLDQLDVAENPPVMTGGTIRPGFYKASDHTSYNGPGGLHGFVTGGANGVGLEIAGQSWQTTRTDHGFANVDESYTFATSGNTLTLTRSCPSALTQSFTYTASADTLKLLDADGLLLTFTRQ